MQRVSGAHSVHNEDKLTREILPERMHKRRLYENLNIYIYLLLKILRIIVIFVLLSLLLSLLLLYYYTFKEYRLNTYIYT